MEIYFSRSGERYGPFSIAEVQADIDAGNILATDLAWHAGAEDWSEVWQIEGITVPKRRVPPPPPPVIRAAYYPSAPGKSSSGGEMGLLVILTLLIPLAGLIIGIIRISDPAKRNEGGILLALSIGLMIFYVILLSQI
jgi:hypothetical protein